MTMISIHDGAPRRQPSSIAKALLDRLTEAVRRRCIRRETKELSKLSRHLLRDVGLEQYAASDDAAIPHHWR